MEEMSWSCGDIQDSVGHEGRHIILGVCAMSKKSRSKPMLEILDRLALYDYIEPLIFEEDIIISKPVEEWPICDCLMSFHSKGFPLDKAVAYAELRKPMLINDLYMQYKIQDRREVHSILDDHNIGQPRYAVLDRDTQDRTKCQIMETEDHVDVNNVTFHKPFVEKPVNAEDHNVYIYFPAAAGGGSQRLFRKIGSRSSVYSPISTIRKTGSFIYEDFMPTDGTDVKVYTVGPDYAHAEARKSPALDGKVERDKDGKEVRYPVLLSSEEKLLARKVCLAFKQSVCGFDLLRANGCSYVCDVNGFSFVKTSPKYYDDCAKILGNMIMREIAPLLGIPYCSTYQIEDIPIVPTTYGTMMELRCVTAVIRHGDRTPKQKMKMEVRHKKFFDLFEKYGGFKTGHLKLKRPKQLQEVLDISRFLLDGIGPQQGAEVEENRSKLEQLRAVLEMYGHFSGINRKIQFKHQPHGAPKRSSSDDDDQPREPSLVLILKWGGELTPAGKIQAEELGKAFRCMYPGGQGDYGGSPGLGLMRLQSTFRHDLKIYASDEGRVQMTAAAFAKGLLALEGELTPILVQMVKSANMNGLLDNDNEASNYQNILKEKLQCILNQDRDFNEEDEEKLMATKSYSLSKAMEFVKNPYAACCQIHEIMQQLLVRIHALKDDPRTSEMKLYHGESWELMTRRWSKLVKDYKSHKHHMYDISKIPDIYDCIKYDLQHNMKILRFPAAEELHALSKAMADIVIPQEYGITMEEKLMIGTRICTPLLRKILTDIHRNVDEESTRLDSRYSEGVSSPHRHVRTRLYFTSESHIHSLLTVLRYGDLCDAMKDEQWARAMDYIDRVTELNYMTQIVIMTYEDPTKDLQSDERFHVELHFSPGAYCAGPNKNYPPGPGYRSQLDKQREESVEEEKKSEKIRDVATAPADLKLLEDNGEEGSLRPHMSTLRELSETSDTPSASHKPGKGPAATSPVDAPRPKVLKLDDKTKRHSNMEAESSEACCSFNIGSSDSESICTDIGSAHVAFDICEDMSIDESSSIAQQVADESDEKADLTVKVSEATSSESHTAVDSEEVLPEHTVSEPVPISRRRHQSAEGSFCDDLSLKENKNLVSEKRSSSYEKHSESMSDQFGWSPQKSTSYENNTQKKADKMQDPAEARRRSFLSLFANKDFEKMDIALPTLISLIMETGVKKTSGVEGWRVSSIRPLETLHNALTLKQMETFLAKVADSTGTMPSYSNQGTPTCITPRSSHNPTMLNLPQHPGYISAGSSSGPSSPTCVSSPDDIMHKLKQLIGHTD